MLDYQKQPYVGPAANIRKRIKQRWGDTKQFNRLVFGDSATSVLSIASLQAAGHDQGFYHLQIPESVIEVFARFHPRAQWSSC